MPKTKARTPNGGVYKHILFPIDISDKSVRTKEVEVISGLIRHFGAALTIITVLPDFGAGAMSQYFSKVAEDKIQKEAEQALANFVQKHFGGNKNIQTIVTQGGIYERIIEAARKVEADVIVMTAHRPGLQDYLLGPNAAKVVRHSEISVLVIRED